MARRFVVLRLRSDVVEWRMLRPLLRPEAGLGCLGCSFAIGATSIHFPPGSMTVLKQAFKARNEAIWEGKIENQLVSSVECNDCGSLVLARWGSQQTPRSDRGKL